MSIFTAAFAKATAERAISTAAQSAIAMLSADGLGVLNTDWGQVGSVTALAAILSILKALAASQLGDGGPSLTSAETVTPDDDAHP